MCGTYGMLRTTRGHPPTAGKPESLKHIEKIMNKKSLLLMLGLIGLPLCMHAVAGEQKAQAVTPADQDHAALESIQGKWKLVTMRAAGNDAPPQVIATYRYEFKGDQLTITPNNPQANGDFLIKLDPSAKPLATLDMTDLAGKHKGRTLLGIYAIEDGKLKICFAKDNRPSGFIATEQTGYGQILIELERELEE